MLDRVGLARTEDWRELARDSALETMELRTAVLVAATEARDSAEEIAGEAEASWAKVRVAGRRARTIVEKRMIAVGGGSWGRVGS